MKYKLKGGFSIAKHIPKHPIRAKISVIRPSYCTDPSIEDDILELLRISDFQPQKIWGEYVQKVEVEYDCNLIFHIWFYRTPEQIDYDNFYGRCYNPDLAELDFVVNGEAWERLVEKHGGYETCGLEKRVPECYVREH